MKRPKSETTRRLVLNSGGQTGVDRAVLDFAISRHIPYSGWCPSGGWAEDLTVPPGLLAKYPNLKETPSIRPEQRTAWNVRDSHASLVVVKGGNFGFSQGTVFTVECATLIFMRPCRVVDATSDDAVQSVRDWLNYLAGSIDDRSLVLNVAGPRESEQAGIYAAALEFLSKLFGDRVVI
jgi:Circularly permutated YpsA SLOG family